MGPTGTQRGKGISKESQSSCLDWQTCQSLHIPDDWDLRGKGPEKSPNRKRRPEA